MSNTPRPAYGTIVWSKTIRTGGKGPAGPKPMSLIGRHETFLRLERQHATGFIEEMRRRQALDRIYAAAEAKGFDASRLREIEANHPSTKKRGKKAFRRRFR